MDPHEHLTSLPRKPHALSSASPGRLEKSPGYRIWRIGQSSLDSRNRVASDRIAVVTGASRGAGLGIARALGATGATVYVTGRTREEDEGGLPGSVFLAAEAVTGAGGVGIPVICDHADDAQVAALFNPVETEQGRLDILVNNATALPEAITEAGPFWEKPLSMTCLFDVGLRSHYVAAWYAAPLLLANGEGLVVNIIRRSHLHARASLRCRQGRRGQNGP